MAGSPPMPRRSEKQPGSQGGNNDNPRSTPAANVPSTTPTASVPPPSPTDHMAPQDDTTPTRTSTTRRFNRQDYDEYNRVMKDLGYGIPILKPCPTTLTNSAAIGDVGYMRDGEFVKLYNIGSKIKLTLERRLSGNEKQKGMGVIASTGIKQPVTVDGSTLPKVTINSDAYSGAALFPLYAFQVESVAEGEKLGLKDLMKKEIRQWTLPPGLTRDELLLVHSRVMAAKWMMLRFEIKQKVNCEHHFTVDIDGKSVESTPATTRIDFAIEQGIDHLALQGSKPKKSEGMRLPSKETTVAKPLSNDSPIRTSNCVFLGVFRMSRSGEIEDTAKELVLARA